jgi:hypothetical protein
MVKEKGLPLGIARALQVKDTKSDKAKGIKEGSKADLMKDKMMLKGRGRGVGKKMKGCK